MFDAIRSIWPWSAWTFIFDLLYHAYKKVRGNNCTIIDLKSKMVLVLYSYLHFICHCEFYCNIFATTTDT